MLVEGQGGGFISSGVVTEKGSKFTCVCAVIGLTRTEHLVAADHHTGNDDAGLIFIFSQSINCFQMCPVFTVGKEPVSHLKNKVNNNLSLSTPPLSADGSY